MSMSCRDICLMNLDLRHRHLPEINKYVRQPQRPFKSQRLEDPRVGGQRASPPVHDHIWSQSGQQRLSASQHTLHKELDATNPSAACVVTASSSSRHPLVALAAASACSRWRAGPHSRAILDPPPRPTLLSSLGTRFMYTVAIYIY